MSERFEPVKRTYEMGDVMEAGEYGLHLSDETKVRWSIEARNDLRRDVGEWATELAFENADLAALSATVPDGKLVAVAGEAIDALPYTEADGSQRHALLHAVKVPAHLARAVYVGLYSIASWRSRAEMWLAGESRLRVGVAPAEGVYTCSMPDSSETAERWGYERDVWTVAVSEARSRLAQRYVDVAYAPNLRGKDGPKAMTLEEILGEFVVEQAEARLLYLSTEPWMRAAVVHNQDQDSLVSLVQGFTALVRHYVGGATDVEKPALATQIEEGASLVAQVGLIRFGMMPSDEVLRSRGVDEYIEWTDL